MTDTTTGDVPRAKGPVKPRSTTRIVKVGRTAATSEWQVVRVSDGHVLGTYRTRAEARAAAR